MFCVERFNRDGVFALNHVGEAFTLNRGLLEEIGLVFYLLMMVATIYKHSMNSEIDGTYTRLLHHALNIN